MKAVIYARYSSDLQRPESIEDQVSQCVAYIETKGWNFSREDIYTDSAISGTDWQRPGYLALMEAARAGDFNVVVVDDLSRLGRDTAESIRVYKELELLEVGIVGVADNIDTLNGSNKLPYFFKSMINELYLDDLKDKVIRGMKGQVMRGFSVGGRIYGYKRIDIPDPSGTLDKHGRPRRLGVRLEIDQEQADVIRQIFEWKIMGMGIKAITKLLNEKGVTPPQNPRSNHKRSWATSTVWGILRNEKYIGDWTWNKHKWPKKVGSSKRKKVILPESEWVKQTNEDLRIIDQRTWDLLMKQKRARKPKNPPKNGKFNGYQGTGHRASYLLSGLLKCGECGGSLITISSGKRSVFVCNNHWSRGNTVCTNKVRVKRAEVEDIVLETLKERLLKDDCINFLQAEVKKILCNKRATSTSSVSALSKRKTRLKSELTNLIGFVAQGDTSQSVRDAIKEKEAELASLQGQLESMERLEAKGGQEVTRKVIKERIGRLRELFTGRTESLKIIQAELRNLLADKISLTPSELKDRVQISGRIRVNLAAALGMKMSVIYGGGGGNRTPVRI